MLNENQKRFFDLLDRTRATRELARFWSAETRSLNLEALVSAAGCMSTGEQILAGFLAELWCGSPQEGLPPLTLAGLRRLDHEHRAIVGDWLADPYIP